MAAIQPTADIGLVGLAVMGENLVLNMANHGYTVAVFNRTTSRVDAFMADRAKGKTIIGTHSVEELVANLKRPRKIMIMVKAGNPVDQVIDELVPLLDKGDVLIDGGNSHFPDSTRRTRALKEKGILFVGTGVSGGEEGALKGPSIMPGGNPDAWPLVKPIFQDIAAKAPDGTPCCDWVGPDGAGHYVKMVHNGIEYGDMQLICEAYALLRRVLGLSNARTADVFSAWNATELDSYLIEITANILRHLEPDGHTHTVDVILDKAGQKGTGKWTVESALEYGVPVTLIAEAVFARSLSAAKADRLEASAILAGPPTPDKRDFTDDFFIEAVRQALYASKIVSYAQGYMLMREASKQLGWNLNYGGIALMWRGGCIIRSKFLANIRDAFDRQPTLSNLLLDQFFADAVQNAQASWRFVVAQAALHGVPCPTFMTALAYYDAIRSDLLPANLLQAQRDYFGAHTYERIDKPAGQWFHTNWTGTGGNATASTYNA